MNNDILAKALKFQKWRRKPGQGHKYFDFKTGF